MRVFEVLGSRSQALEVEQVRQHPQDNSLLMAHGGDVRCMVVKRTQGYSDRHLVYNAASQKRAQIIQVANQLSTTSLELFHSLPFVIGEANNAIAKLGLG